MCQRIPRIFWWGRGISMPKKGLIQIKAFPLRNFKKAPLNKRGGGDIEKINKTVIFSK